MTMNKQGADKIDWTDWTWNPIAGCLHGCPYCYMLRLEKRFKGTMKPKFRPNYLLDPGRKQKPAKIFVCSSGDMWGKWVEPSWIHQVLDVCRATPWHTYQFLTKNPERYAEFDLPENGWYGTTVDGDKHGVDKIDSLYSYTGDRIKFVSFEPLLKKIYQHELNLSGIHWIIIGANSNRGAEKPPFGWADRIVNVAKQEGCRVWIKDNYTYFPHKLKEFPEV